ncbi:hypothetical protein ASF12_05360 [Paenibacillus sp. Leaf72]|nr:hypothetical protein ASF12_05360 [Paenibacillus sp. Leaf72]
MVMRRVAVIRKMPRWDGEQSPLELDLLWQYEAMVTTEAWQPSTYGVSITSAVAWRIISRKVIFHLPHSNAVLCS